MPTFRIRYDKIITCDVEIVAEDQDEVEMMWSDNADYHHDDAFELYSDYHLIDVTLVESDEEDE